MASSGGITYGSGGNITMKNNPSDRILAYLRSSFFDGSDSTADVLLHCSNGVIPTHRLVLASISSMLASIFKQDAYAWNESTIVILMSDFTVEQVSNYFENLYVNGSSKGNIADERSFIAVRNTLGASGFLPMKNEEKASNNKTEFNDTAAEKVEIDVKLEILESDTNDDDYNGENLDENDMINDEKCLYPEVKQTKVKSDVKTEKSHRDSFYTVDPNDSTKWKCTFCEKSITKANISKHIKKQHQQKVPTDASGKTARKPIEARKYFDVDENNPLSCICKLCQKEIVNVTHRLAKHLRYKHTETFKALNPLKYQRKYQRKLGEYYSEIPDNPAKYLCSLCNKEITTENIIRHIHIIHKIFEEGYDHAKAAEKNKGFCCNFCGKSFTQKHNFNEHMLAKHSNEKLGEDIVKAMGTPSVCSFCGNQFLTKTTLKYHKCEAKEADFKCNKCEVTFYTPHQLKRHNKVCDKFDHCRDAIRSLTCTACNIKFEDYRKFIVHCVNSTSCTLLGNKPYVCDEYECGKMFATKELLALHTRVHTGETPYQCQFCLKKFKFVRRLHYHQCPHKKLIDTIENSIPHMPQ